MSLPPGVFAPPRASLELHGQSGEVRAEGRLVKMERSGRLPDRCVSCNARADGPRLARTLNHLATPWRVVLIAAPLLYLLFGEPLGIPHATVFAFPVAVACWLIFLLLRRRVSVDLGVCARHRRQRTALHFAVLACLVVVLLHVLLVFVARDWADSMAIPAFIAVPAMLILGVAESLTGARCVGVARLDATHVWFKGMGQAFRASLPGATRAKG